MTNEHVYTVRTAWTRERSGMLSSADLNDSLEVATPPPFPKGIERVWSPEHLLVAAVNACLMTTFLAIAENSKLEFTTYEAEGTGKLEMVDNKYLITEITLFPIITLKNEADKDKAMRVLLKSEANCLISNSVKSKVILVPEFKFSTQQEAA